MARQWITGDAELERTLAALGDDKAADRVAKSAIGAGLTVLRKAIRAAAPVGPTGNLKASIGRRLERATSRRRSVGKAGINVGKQSSRSKEKVNAPHSHLVALGTKQRFHKSGKSVGRMTPNPFVRLATVASTAAVSQAMHTRAAKALERERLKALRKSR